GQAELARGIAASELQQVVHAPREADTGARIDDLRRVATGAARFAHRGVGATEEIVDRGQLAAGDGRETLAQAVERAAELEPDVATAAEMALGQPLGRLLEEAGLLLDQQEPPRRRDDDEVDLADRREAALDPRPVHAVEDRDRIGQAGLEP